MRTSVLVFLLTSIPLPQARAQAESHGDPGTPRGRETNGIGAQ